MNDSPIRYNEHDDVEINYVPSTVLFTEETLRQRIAFDMVPDDMLATHQRELGLQPCSPEVLRFEYAGGAARLDALGPLRPLIGVLARLSTEVLEAAMLVKAEADPEFEPNEIDESDIHAASVAILSTLVNMGVLDVVTKKTKLIGDITA